MLPGSRNTTYAAGSKVLPPDLNALQDGIVGSKHASLARFLAAGKWRPKSGGTLGAGQWTASGANAFVAALDYLMVGSRITTIRWTYNNLGANPGVTMTLNRRLMDGTAEESLVTNSDNASTGFGLFAMTCNHTTVGGYLYYLTFTTTVVNQILLGAEVDSDRL